MSLHAFQRRVRSTDTVQRTGTVRRILPSHIEADGPNVGLGALCSVESSGPAPLRAEVVRVDRDHVVLSPFDEGARTFSGARVTALVTGNDVPVGPGFLGRAVDAFGNPADGLGSVRGSERLPLFAVPPSPLDRISSNEILATGIRAIDGLVTLGKGQRVGVFAASGVGKTSLLTQIARQASADILILCLVGERGREVEAIWNAGLDPETGARATLVTATSDQSAAMRVRAANYALSLAEYWRGQGKHVLFLLDSVTRLAMALREMGLAAGEPPTVRAYTPNVFAALPKLVERCGALKAGGAISGIFTVLSETDEIDDPVCELMKSLLDGHVVLSRTLAEQAQFPAVDVPRSISRQAETLMRDEHRRGALQALEWLSLFESSRTLINTGLYAKGADARIDRAVERHPEIVRFLKQGRDEAVPLHATLSELGRVVAGRT